MLSRFTTAQVDVQNFALVTHSVPAERVRRHLPDGLELETYETESGDEHAFISTSSFCNRQIHWSASRYPAHDFDQSTFRTYVSYRGRRSAFFLGSYVSTRLSLLAQAFVAVNSRLGRFDVVIEKDGRGYHFYSSTVTGRLGEMHVQIQALDQPEAKHPFDTAEAHVQTLLFRLHGLSHSPFFGGVSYGPIEHRLLRPWSGQLLQGRFDFWADRGILPPDEWMTPFSVLVDPSVRFTLHPPRPAAV